MITQPSGLPDRSGSATLWVVSGRGKGEQPVDVGVDDVAALRTLLRRADPSARRLAVETLEDWRGARLDAPTASAVLRAATAAYPWLSTDRTDPADRLVRLLWADPQLVPIGEIEGAYLIAGDRVRRSLLHLLALRRDQDGLRAVAFLIGTDGPVDLLPLPTTALLDPLLDLPEAVELAPALARVASRRGWAWHACDLLCRLAGTDRLAPEVAADVVATVAPLVLELVDTCDRVVLVPGERTDPTRADRHRIGALVRLLHAMAGDQSDRLLYRVLSAVDPRVAAGAAVALVDHGRPVAPERLELVCRDPEARALLLDGLDDVGRADLVPAPFGRGPQRAEADLVRWLVCETELGSRPDEIEWIGALPIDAGADSPPLRGLEPGSPWVGDAHLFRFRVRAPHWSCARGWMVGAAGPYRADGSRGSTVEPFAFSLYDAEDEDGPDGHLRAILHAVSVWPDAGDVPG